MSIDWGGYLAEGAGGAATGASIGSIAGAPGAAIGGVLGGGLGLLHHFLAGDPYKKAEEQVNKGWAEAQNYENPYNKGGLEQYGKINQATNDLLTPEGLENKWANSYQNSPYANQLLAQNEAAGLDAASSMGLLGSSAALGNIQQGAGNIVNQQRQQYINDLMQQYMGGIGLGQNLYGVGANTATNLGNQAITQGENRAGLDYARTTAPTNIFDQGLNYGLKTLIEKGASNSPPAYMGKESPYVH